jgi:hypothetical protein
MSVKMAVEVIGLVRLAMRKRFETVKRSRDCRFASPNGFSYTKRPSRAIATERPGTSNLRINAVATAAICSCSDGEISSAGKARASAPEPQNGMARVEADRMRCMASLLVMGGMKISQEYLA